MSIFLSFAYLSGVQPEIRGIVEIWLDEVWMRCKDSFSERERKTDLISFDIDANK